MTVMVAVLMIIINLGPGTPEGYAGELCLDMKKVVEVGKKEDIFYFFNSVCEDDDGNFYVLDNKRYNVLKFSPEGKYLLSFGNRGEGPGDFKAPSRVYYSENLGVVVTEAMNEASIFTRDGQLVKKINFSKTLGLLFNIRYIGGELFYAEQQRDKGVRRQILMDISGKIVNSELFSGSGWEITMEDGMRYRLYFKELTPQLIFDGYKSYGVVGTSDQYWLKLINAKGHDLKDIGLNVEGNPLLVKEREYFIKEISNVQGWSKQVKKAFEKKIPKLKMLYYNVMLTSRYIFVFRIKADVTDEKAPYPVDVFDMNGKFIGEVSMLRLPLRVSDKYIYLREGDEEESSSIYLAKYSYSLTPESKNKAPHLIKAGSRR